MDRVFKDATDAFNGLTLSDKGRLQSDWYDVVATFFSLRPSAANHNKVINETFTKHGIDKRGMLEQTAYRALLLNVFVFGSEAKEAAARRGGLK